MDLVVPATGNEILIKSRSHFGICLPWPLLLPHNLPMPRSEMPVLRISKLSRSQGVVGVDPASSVNSRKSSLIKYNKMLDENCRGDNTK
jgi:hypothetical protein